VQVCYQLNNFATAKALLAGLRHSAVARLKHTWEVCVCALARPWMVCAIAQLITKCPTIVVPTHPTPRAQQVPRARKTELKVQP
jgi:hypothetical protein